MIRLLIVSRVRLYREGLAQALTPNGALDVVGQLSDPEATLACLRSIDVDTVLLDMSTDETHALAREMRATFPEIPIVALGVQNPMPTSSRVWRLASPPTSPTINLSTIWWRRFTTPSEVSSSAHLA